MKNKILLFDLDSTIYYVGDRMENLCDNNVVSYFIKNLNVDEIKAKSIMKELRKKYRYDSEASGKELPFDSGDFIEYICNVPTDELYEDKELDNILKQIPNTKYIITDSTQNHTIAVLKKMAIDINNFVYVYDAHDMKYVFKYNKSCYEMFLQKFALKSNECVIFEDSLKNLESAKACGMTTVYIRPNTTEKPACADYIFSDIKTALKVLFNI